MPCKQTTYISQQTDQDSYALIKVYQKQQSVCFSRVTIRQHLIYTTGSPFPFTPVGICRERVHQALPSCQSVKRIGQISRPVYGNYLCLLIITHTQKRGWWWKMLSEFSTSRNSYRKPYTQTIWKEVVLLGTQGRKNSRWSISPNVTNKRFYQANVTADREKGGR